MCSGKKKQDSALPIKGSYHQIPFCFAPALWLIPEKFETQGEQRFRCVSKRVKHRTDMVLNQVWHFEEIH